MTVNRPENEEDETKELEQIIEKERRQGKLINYIQNTGKWLLYSLSIMLVLLTITTFFIGFTFLFRIIFYACLMIYIGNSISFVLGGYFTKKALSSRLKYERKQGTPLESIDGFDVVHERITKVIRLLRWTGLMSFGTILCFSLMLFLNELLLGFFGAGLTLFSLGIILQVRSLNLNLREMHGLQDFFQPSVHSIFLDHFFADIFTNHLDPISSLKWNEFLTGIQNLLTSDFIQQVQSREETEDPLSFAIENILYLYFLEYQNIITEAQLHQELNEIIQLNQNKFDLEKGVKRRGKWYFSKKEVQNIFEYIQKYNPGFFRIMDRLQLQVRENMEQLAHDPIYFDTAAQEITYLTGKLNLVLFHFNNLPEEKNYKLRIQAPGFNPSQFETEIQVEGRGTFELPSHSLPLISQKRDTIDIVSPLLENGDTLWLTFQPIRLGTHTLQIFLLDENGTIIEGKTKTVKISKNTKYFLKKMLGRGSMIGGIGFGLARVIPYLLS